MDFIVSKVAMSICALLVVSVLGGVLEGNALFRNTDELDSVLNDLSTALENPVWSGCEVDMKWSVPFLSDGTSMSISVDNHALSARAGEKSASLKPACNLHTWAWDGNGLNRSSIAILDAKAPPVESSSGFALEIRTRLISFENQDRVFIFVNAAA